MDPRELELLETVADAVEARLEEAASDRFDDRAGMGADGTPTKWVDEVAEEVILEHVEEAELNLNVLSEEAGLVDNGAERTLVTDPVDGTTNASRGIPVYCTSLAIGEDTLSSVDVGLVRNIPTGQTYRVQAGEGATLDGEPIEPVEYDAETAALSGAVARDRDPQALVDALERGDFRDFRHLGSATLEMCFVAQGALDVYYHPTQALRVMDVAASTLVVREAGGHVLDAAGDALDMPLGMKTRRSVLALGDRRALNHLEVLT
jgi:fructose-1,6-bisphosphatase/inositol monophosphatase family enzyme